MVTKMLQRLVMVNNSNVCCPLCNEEESANHLFLHCRWAWNLWGTGMRWWGVACCASESIEEWAKC